MNSNINYLLSELDNIEIIRNQTAAILKIETENQYSLALESGAPDKRDYKIPVYVEKARPWDITGETADQAPFPLINILLTDIKQEAHPGSAVNEKKYTGTFFIDCYGCGNISIDNEIDISDHDSLGTIRAWKTARIARRILMSSYYTYLGLRGVVKKREIIQIATGAPQNMPESAVSVTTCRISFVVEYFEKSPQAEGVPFEGILFKSLSDTGEILIDI
jgi:hypothetical protein